MPHGNPPERLGVLGRLAVLVVLAFVVLVLLSAIGCTPARLGLPWVCDASGSCGPVAP